MPINVPINVSHLGNLSKWYFSETEMHSSTWRFIRLNNFKVIHFYKVEVQTYVNEWPCHYHWSKQEPVEHISLNGSLTD
jgi:hypothetical protein